MSDSVCEEIRSKIALDRENSAICVNQDEIDALQKSPTFSSRLLVSTYIERPFFYFRHHGDSLEGFLGCKHSNASIHRSCSRVIDTATGPEEFFVNQKLARVIDKYELEGKYVRITYIGDEYTGFGHARKVYRVEKFPMTDRERITVQTELLKGKDDGQEHTTGAKAESRGRGKGTSASSRDGLSDRSGRKPGKSAGPGK